MTALTPQGSVEWLMLVAGALGAVAAIWRLGIRPAYHFVRAVGDGVEYVRNQLVNNGGSTIRDAIDRTEALAIDTRDKLEALADRVEFLEEIRRKQDEVDRVVAENSAKLAQFRPTMHLPPVPPLKETP